jgi:hypothetical protein
MTVLLERAIAAHGGRHAWHGREHVEVEVEVGGAAWPLRLRRRPGLLRARVRTADPWTEFRGFPRSSQRGVFEPGRVRIEDDERRVIAERGEPRASFARISRKVRWDDLDFLYFAGYAMWNYLAFPFMLERPGFRVQEQPGGLLAVGFPDGFPTHSPEQRFHLDGDHLLVRHDYTAHVFGGWARAAHLSSEHREFDGLVLPTRRRVRPRLPAGRVAPAPVIVSLDVLSARASA